MARMPRKKMSKEEREAIQREKEKLDSKRGGGGGDIAWYQLPIGKTRMRILAPGKVMRRHYLDQIDQNIVCPELSWPEEGAKCPVCELRGTFEKHGINPDEVKGLVPAERCYVNALIRNPEDKKEFPPETVRVVSLPPSIYSWWLGTRLEMDEEDPPIDILDHRRGVDVTFEKYKVRGKGRGGGIRYRNQSLLPRSTPIAEEKSARKAIRKEIIDLEIVFAPQVDDEEFMEQVYKAAKSLLQYFELKDVPPKASVGRVTEEEWDDEEEEEKPRKKKKAKKTKKKKVKAKKKPEPEDEEDDEEEWPDEDEDEEDDEDQEDENDEDEDEGEDNEEDDEDEDEEEDEDDEGEDEDEEEDDEEEDDEEGDDEDDEDEDEDEGDEVTTPAEAFEALGLKKRKVKGKKPKGAPPCFSQHEKVVDAYPDICFTCLYEPECKEAEVPF